MRLTCLALLTLALTACGGPRLGEFLAQPSADPGPNGQFAQEPYGTVITLFDYIAPESEPDQVVDGKPFYYVYMWLPEAVPELGIRMVSPVRNVARPGSDDVATAEWEVGQADHFTFFDTYISFERSRITERSEIPGARTADWRRIAFNDDSPELHAQPTGDYHNSLLRVTERRELTYGLVRIGFTDFKNEQVEGTYLIQVGIRADGLEGVHLARTPEELHAKLLAQMSSTN